MKMGRLINKGKSLIVTVWALSLITTNAEPKRFDRDSDV